MNKMNLKNALAVLVFAMVAGSVFGQDTAAIKKPEQSKIRSYSDVITAKAVSKTGLFTTHRVDDKYYFEITFFEFQPLKLQPLSPDFQRIVPTIKSI